MRLAGEPGEIKISEARVSLEVIMPPLFDLLPGVVKRQKPVGVQALVA
jgi:hypothetical protein